MYKRAAQQLPLKFKPRSGVYEASNVWYSPSNKEARSYDWWVFVREIGGKMVFNHYRYSNSTTKHQWKVRRLLQELGIKIDLNVSTRTSLCRFESLNELAKGHEDQKLADAAAAETKRIYRLEQAKARRFQKKMNAEGLFTAQQWTVLHSGYSTESSWFKRVSRL